MSQAASPRFRPNREIIWHPGRYLPESRGKRNTTLIVCGHLIPQTGNKHYSSYAEWYTNFKHRLYASNRSKFEKEKWQTKFCCHIWVFANFSCLVASFLYMNTCRNMGVLHCIYSAPNFFCSLISLICYKCRQQVWIQFIHYFPT